MSKMRDLYRGMHIAINKVMALSKINPIFNVINVVRHNTYQPQYVLLKQFDYKKC